MKCFRSRRDRLTEATVDAGFVAQSTLQNRRARSFAAKPPPAAWLQEWHKVGRRPEARHVVAGAPVLSASAIQLVPLFLRITMLK
jgi:hypothetical protein